MDQHWTRSSTPGQFPLGGPCCRHSIGTVALFALLHVCAADAMGQNPRLAPSATRPETPPSELHLADPDDTHKLTELADPNDTYKAIEYAQRIDEMIRVADKKGVPYPDGLVVLIEHFYRFGHRDLSELQGGENSGILSDLDRVEVPYPIITRRFTRDFVLVLFNNLFPKPGDESETQAGVHAQEEDQARELNRQALRSVFNRLIGTSLEDLEGERRRNFFFQLAGRIVDSEGIEELEGLVSRHDPSERDLARIEKAIEAARTRLE